MRSEKVVVGERWFGELFAAFQHIADTSADRRSRRQVEGVLEALFAVSAPRGKPGFRAFFSLLDDHKERVPEARPWLALAKLHLTRRKDDLAALLDALDRELLDATPRARWLVAADAAWLLWQREGAARAFERFSPIEPALDHESARNDSPLVVSALLTGLGLAAAVGHADIVERTSNLAKTLWPEEHPSAVRVALALVDHSIASGDYQTALRRLDTLEGAARGDLRMHLLAARLHALAESGKGNGRKARLTYRAFREASRASGSPPYALPLSERRALLERTNQVARAVGLSRRKGPRHANLLSHLLQREQEARRIKDPTRRNAALLRVIQRTEALLLRTTAEENPEGVLRLKLLWCRIVVDLGQDELFEMCERILDQALVATERLNRAPLKMLTLDQRAVLRARKNPVDWPGAVKDSTDAAAIAMELLGKNADPQAPKAGERALLASLLPVIDRVIDLHTEGALRIAALHRELLSAPLGEHDALLDEETPRGSFLRFGRVLHTFAEQSQALALAEARMSFGEGRTRPHRFAIATQGEARIVVDTFANALREQDAVLQYFVFGRYVIVFAYGRRFFDWHIAVVPEVGSVYRAEPAHRRVEELLRVLRGFTQGERESVDADALAELSALVLPEKIDAALALAGIQHLRIVPHDVLYRVPFGRLATARGPLLHRFSMSLHPTGRLAAEAASGARGSPSGKPRLGFFFGPEVHCTSAEESALRRGVEAALSLARVEPVDGRTQGLDDLLAKASSFELLHFLCHGEEGGSFGRSPALRLGKESGARLEVPRLLRHSLKRCTLVVLQSCWTGWMDHRRTNPVQGFPQAFCDAGAMAVIAPLTKIPEALAPLFSEVFYRALRFLPAEQALQRAIAVIRRYGAVLAARDPDAKQALAEHGSVDALEYRYVGVTGLSFGGFVSRCLGRLSFWWWERSLRRGLPGETI